MHKPFMFSYTSLLCWCWFFDLIGIFTAAEPSDVDDNCSQAVLKYGTVPAGDGRRTEALRRPDIRSESNDEIKQATHSF